MKKLNDPLNGMVEVKPCPFCCGQQLDFIVIEDGITIQCFDCGATGPNHNWREERAIYAWNHRADNVTAKATVEFVSYQDVMAAVHRYGDDRPALIEAIYSLPRFPAPNPNWVKGQADLNVMGQTEDQFWAACKW